jgi:hypothetical protein
MKRWHSAIIHFVLACNAAVLVLLILLENKSNAASGHHVKPLINDLPLFTAANMPAIGPAAIEATEERQYVDPRRGLIHRRRRHWLFLGMERHRWLGYR